MHLTLNAEYDLYRWGPITQAPSLLDGDGGFPRTVDDVWDHADLDEVRRELPGPDRAGDPVGLRRQPPRQSHMGTLQLRPEFFDVYLELAVEFGAARSASRAPRPKRTIGFPFRRLAAEEGVLFPDHFVPARAASAAGARSSGSSHDFRPGVTEVLRPPAVDTPELRALSPTTGRPGSTTTRSSSTTSARRSVDRTGVHLIGFRQLRDRAARRLMRRGLGRQSCSSRSRPSGSPLAGTTPSIPGRADLADSTCRTTVTIGRSTSSGIEPARAGGDLRRGGALANEDDVPHSLHRGRSLVRHRRACNPARTPRSSCSANPAPWSSTTRSTRTEPARCASLLSVPAQYSVDARGSVPGSPCTQALAVSGISAISFAMSPPPSSAPA